MNLRLLIRFGLAACLLAVLVTALPADAAPPKMHSHQHWHRHHQRHHHPQHQHRNKKL